ncbi:MAG TPA: hypothetical protein VFK44_14565 [Bacillales bacterium]|nr:hypothetical protein [Bacillales bacterium]
MKHVMGGFTLTVLLMGFLWMPMFLLFDFIFYLVIVCARKFFKKRRLGFPFSRILKDIFSLLVLRIVSVLICSLLLEAIGRLMDPMNHPKYAFHTGYHIILHSDVYLFIFYISLLLLIPCGLWAISNLIRDQGIRIRTVWRNKKVRIYAGINALIIVKAFYIFSWPGFY